jgi:hypothetical protein
VVELLSGAGREANFHEVNAVDDAGEDSSACSMCK